MNSIYYVGMDILKKPVTICVKNREGEVARWVTVDATRKALARWADALGRPWRGGWRGTFWPWTRRTSRSDAVRISRRAARRSRHELRSY